jgi:hypothetical protein
MFPLLGCRGASNGSDAISSWLPVSNAVLLKNGRLGEPSRTIASFSTIARELRGQFVVNYRPLFPHLMDSSPAVDVVPLRSTTVSV